MATRLRALAIALLLLTLAPTSQPAEMPSPALAMHLLRAPQAVYSADPQDSWNRIFYYLFSRRFGAYMSADLPEGAPFRDFGGVMGFDQLQVSTRTFEREETGDRAIDPLYPSEFTDEGARVVLLDPAYAEFCEALEQALHENKERTFAARALMQSDLWSAFDILFIDRRYRENGEPGLEPRRLALLDRLGRLIARIALTPDQIRSLPNNSVAVRTQTSLPDLFGKGNGWTEVQWFPYRLHDVAAGNRRVTRIFLRPTRPPGNVQRFLNDLRKPAVTAAATLDGAALAIQPLLIDTHGRLQPGNLTTDVQVRFFHRTSTGALQKTEIGVYEISRQRLLSEPASGGLTAEAESDPAYAESAGNDYTFASRIPSKQAPSAPVVLKLRTRCVSCHGSEDLTNVMTFAMIVPPNRGLGPVVRQLDPSAHEAAEFVMSQKTKSSEWKALQKYFENPSRNAVH